MHWRRDFRASTARSLLRFGHPYAVVAVTTDPTGGAGPWHGLPVFSAWVSEPEEATDDAEPDGDH